MPLPQVGIIMGSDSDLTVMQEAAHVLEQFSISYEITIVSAHRTPIRMMEYATKAKSRGLKIIIAGAGGAAHLPGMVASATCLPVIGVPIKSSHSLEGWDSVLSILQMPGGIPVATVALNGAKNAALLALRILAVNDNGLAEKLKQHQKQLEENVLQKVEQLKNKWPNEYDK
jgi:5-(carboxyamino)imidazole ribonucleotide mutase